MGATHEGRRAPGLALETWEVHAVLKNFSTLGRLRCATCHRSYCCCKSSHMLGSVPKALDNRSAIAAVNDARPFSSRESVDRATRSFFAATQTCMEPRCSRSNSPGWGGLYIVIGIVNL